MRLSHRPGATNVALGFLVLGPLLLRNFGQEASERTPMETWDDRLIKVEKSAPGFGGMFTGEDGQLVVYLLDPSQIAVAREAIKAVFGPSQVPAAGIRAVRGKYTVSQLKRWSDRANQLLQIPGVVMVDLDEGRNLVTVGVEEESRVGSVEKALGRLRIPRQAVVIASKGRIVPMDRGSSKKPPK